MIGDRPTWALGGLNSGPHTWSIAGTCRNDRSLTNPEGLPCARRSLGVTHGRQEMCQRLGLCRSHWKCLTVLSTSTTVPSEPTDHTGLSGEGTSSRNSTHPQDPIRGVRSSGSPWLLKG